VQIERFKILRACPIHPSHAHHSTTSRFSPIFLIIVAKMIVGIFQLVQAFTFYNKMHFGCSLRIHTKVAFLLVIVIQICSSCTWVGIIADTELIRFKSSMQILVICLLIYLLISWILVFCVLIIKHLTRGQDESFCKILKSSRNFLITLPDQKLKYITEIWQMETMKNVMVAMMFVAPKETR